MPIPLGFWEWGCPKRGDAHITVTTNWSIDLSNPPSSSIKTNAYYKQLCTFELGTFALVWRLKRFFLYPERCIFSHLPILRENSERNKKNPYVLKTKKYIYFSILKKSVYKGTKEDNVTACLLAQRNISLLIRDELGLPQGFDHVPGNKVSLDGILNLSDKRLAVGITVWSDELLVQSDDNELDDDVREKLYEKR